MKSILILFFLVVLSHAQTIELSADQKTSLRKSVYLVLNHSPDKLNYLTDLANSVSNPKHPNYGNYLSVSEIQFLSTVDMWKIRTVFDWLSYTNINYEFFGDSFRLDLSISEIDQLFQTQTKRYRVGNRYILTSEKEYVTPTVLEPVILFIDGVSNRIYGPTVNKNVSRNTDKGFVAREVFKRVYNLNDDLHSTSNKTSLGVVEYTNYVGFSEESMIKTQIGNGVKKNPIPKDHILGTNQWQHPDGESSLDVSVNYWGAPNASLWYDEFNGWIYGWAANFSNTEEVPQIISISWGWNEAYQCSIAVCTKNSSRIYVQRTNIELMKLALRGITVVVASGDAGSPGRTNEACGSKTNINPIFPGGSPWVTSVGGTYLEKEISFYQEPDYCMSNNITKNLSDFSAGSCAPQTNLSFANWQTPICREIFNCSESLSEAMTTFRETMWTSGSGFTAWDHTPYWQQDFVDNYLQSGVQLPDNKYFNRFGRAYPDVAAFGHNCILYDKVMGGWTTVDGTSCAAPIFAGVLAYLNDYQESRGRPRIGFANPLLYEMRRSMPETFNSITHGNSSCTESTCCGKNFGFLANNLNWDVVSGLGSPNMLEMINYLTHNT